MSNNNNLRDDALNNRQNGRYGEMHEELDYNNQAPANRGGALSQKDPTSTRNNPSFKPQSELQASDINSHFQINANNVPQNDLEQINFELEKADQMGFIRKVYYIFTMQIAVTTCFVALTYIDPNIIVWQQRNMWLFFLCMITTISLQCTLFCNKKMARTVPINFILLGIITACESYTLSMITSQYKPQSVFEVFVMTSAGFIGLSAYAYKSGTDFTVYFGVLFGMSMVLLAAGLLSIFVQSKPLMMLISAAVVCFSMIFIVIDTQMIIQQRKYAISQDDYIVGSLILYIDFINLFIQLLQIFGDRK